MKKEMVIQMVSGHLVHQDEEVSEDFSYNMDEQEEVSSDSILSNLIEYLDAQKDENGEASRMGKALLQEQIELINESADMLSKDIQKKIQKEIKEALTFDFFQRFTGEDAAYRDFFQSITRMNSISKLTLLSFCQFRLEVENDQISEDEREAANSLASMLVQPRYCGYFETPAGIAFCTALGGTIDHFFFVSGVQLEDLNEENMRFFMQYAFSKMEANGVDTSVIEWRNENCQDVFNHIFEGNNLENNQIRILKGGDFEKTVWQALTEIPMGSMTTCTELAKKIGHPDLVAEVAQAVMNNPIPCIIPCHRVIEKIGEKGGYTYPYGQKRQQKLLKAEAKRRAR